MNKDRFLTRQWNNWLSLGFGLPTLVLAIIFLATSWLSDFGAFIGIIVLGVLY